MISVFIGYDPCEAVAYGVLAHSINVRAGQPVASAPLMFGQLRKVPHRGNYLVNYDEPDADVSLTHYTVGGPYFNEFTDCEYSKEWFAEREQMFNAAQRVS